MPDFSAVRGHYSAIIQGQLIQVFLGSRAILLSEGRQMTVTYRQRQTLFLNHWHALLLSSSSTLPPSLSLVAYSTSLALFTPVLQSLFLPPYPKGIFKYRAATGCLPHDPTVLHSARLKAVCSILHQ